MTVKDLVDINRSCKKIIMKKTSHIKSDFRPKYTAIIDKTMLLFVRVESIKWVL